MPASSLESVVCRVELVVIAEACCRKAVHPVTSRVLVSDEERSDRSDMPNDEDNTDAVAG